MFLQFLILGMDRMSHASLWSTFFHYAQAGTWKTWLRYKYHDQCKASLNHSGPAQHVTLVPTVLSSWRSDLMSPMLQLLWKAPEHHLGFGVKETFTFLSDTTLPVKPFWFIHAELSRYPDSSDFAYFRNQMGLVRSGLSQDPNNLFLSSRQTNGPSSRGSTLKHSQTISPLPRVFPFTPASDFRRCSSIRISICTVVQTRSWPSCPSLDISGQ